MTAPLTPRQLDEISQRTLGHYEARARAFWEGTRDHDVSQNVEALLSALPGPGPHRVLDLGCGPGRDLLEFKRRGHEAVGLEGCQAFVSRARASGAEVLHQNLLALDLAAETFDGVFANASLFHVPGQELPRVLRELRASLKRGGALFASNPRGDDREGWNGERYGAFHGLERWTEIVVAAGFEPIAHYYRPDGLPRDRQPWLATLWRRP